MQDSLERRTPGMMDTTRPSNTLTGGVMGHAINMVGMPGETAMTLSLLSWLLFSH